MDETAGHGPFPDVTARRWVRSPDDALALLDALFDDAADRWSDRAGAAWWDAFYAHRGRAVPFFRDAPDESLVAWQDAGWLGVGPATTVLELGCGPGRNAVWLARQGAGVHALDLSPEALAWGRERATAAGVDVRFERADVLRWDPPAGGYDVVVDSGCFHHLPPHRRITYLALLRRALRPGGRFALACFAVGGPDGVTGTSVTDRELYRSGGLGGGLAYTDDDLRSVFEELTPVEVRRMRDLPDDAPSFGRDFLWAALFRAGAGA